MRLVGGRDGPAQATGTVQHAGRPPLPVFTQGPRMRVAQTGAGGSGKGAEGRVQARLRNGDRKGPAGGGVSASAAGPLGPAAGSAAAVASAASVPLVTPGGPSDTYCVRGPVLGPSLWGRGPCSDLGRTTKSEPCSMAGNERKREEKKGLESGGMRVVVFNGVRTDSGAHARPLVAAVGRTGWGGGSREPRTGPDRGARGCAGPGGRARCRQRSGEKRADVEESWKADFSCAFCAFHLHSSPLRAG